MSKNLAWILILIGGFSEIFWVSGLKYADTLVWHVLTIVGIAFSFFCAILAMRAIEVSIVYSVFVGIGTGGVVMADILVFGQEVSILKLILIAMLMLGVLGLKFSVSRTESRQDSQKSYGNCK